jgi:hypothetical protein
VQSTIFVPKRKETTKAGENFVCNWVLHNLFALLDISKEVKSVKFRWLGCEV